MKTVAVRLRGSNAKFTYPPQRVEPETEAQLTCLPCFPMFAERRRLTQDLQHLDSGDLVGLCLGCAVVKSCHQEIVFACILLAILGGDISK